MLSVTAVWRNWGRTESVNPAEVVTPRDTDEVADVVARARTNGVTIKAVGSGHSFSAIAIAPEIQLDMSGQRGLVAVDTATGRATLRAGTTLREIPGLLAPYGLAMANLGDVDAQTISGATSTGTHGTGLRHGGISTQITAVRLVTGKGDVRTVDTSEPQLLSAAALGLGALGVITEVTLQCVPAFTLRAQEGPEQVDDVIDSFLEKVALHDHYEFYWFPHTGFALTKTNTRLPPDTPRSGPGVVRRLLDDEVVSNGLFRATCEVGARFPAAVPRINSLAGNALSARTYTDTSTKVFVSPRRVRFREMEYAIPLDRVPQALNEVRDMINRRGFRVSFPIEVRAAAADDLMLSTASGRDSGYVAVHRYHADPVDGYFDEVERIMADHGGRPHWGKMHTRDARHLRSVYPRFGEFLGVREDFDPDRVFVNPYLASVLGD
ncbi:D-arabinono-1,4-lactone oxidase [Williamsia muralis]|uniref:D-arabinono-1,4-lactone oxidase n=1 Tax=Williamsia marianensis TaxID=85044 RepID=UPI0038003B05